MQDGEDGHLHAQQQARDADLDVRRADARARLDDVQRCQDRNSDGLPKGQEDNELDGDELEKGGVRRDVGLDLEVKGEEAVHGGGDADGGEEGDPDVCESRVLVFQAVEVEGLGDDGDEGEEDADEAVLEDAGPDYLRRERRGVSVGSGEKDKRDGKSGERARDDRCFTATTEQKLALVHNCRKRIITYIEPSQPTPRNAQRSRRPADALPAKGKDPRLRGQVAKILLLIVQVRRNVVAEQVEEGGDGDGLVAVAQNLKVDAVPVVEVGEEGDDGVDGHHEEDADDSDGWKMLVGFFMMRFFGDRNTREGENQGFW